MNSATLRPSAWYFMLAIILLLGGVTLEGVSLVIGSSGSAVQPLLFLYSILAGYMALFLFYSGRNRLWPGLFVAYPLSLTLFLANPRVGSIVLGLFLLAFAGLSAFDNHKTWRGWAFSFQLAELSLACVGLYSICCGLVGREEWFRFSHQWLGSLVIVWWSTGLAWHLLDSGLVNVKKVERALFGTACLILVTGILGICNHLVWFLCDWHWAQLPAVLRLLELLPFLVTLIRARPSYWVGWSALLIVIGIGMPFFGRGGLAGMAVGYHFRALAWALLIQSLIIFPGRHLKQVLGLVPWASRPQLNGRILKAGLVLYALSLWQAGVALLWHFWLYLAAIACLIIQAGYLHFLYDTVRRGPSPEVETGEFIGEGHIVR